MNMWSVVWWLFIGQYRLHCVCLFIKNGSNKIPMGTVGTATFMLATYLPVFTSIYPDFPKFKRFTPFRYLPLSDLLELIPISTNNYLISTLNTYFDSNPTTQTQLVISVIYITLGPSQAHNELAFRFDTARLQIFR